MIGKKLQQLLDVKEITPTAAARGSKVTVATFFNYLKDRAEPTADKLKQICDFFGVTMDWFYSDPFADLKDPNLKAMFEKAGELTDEEKREVVKFIEFTKQNRKEKKAKLNVISHISRPAKESKE